MSHDISNCWLLGENGSNKISQNFAKAQAFSTKNNEEDFDDKEEENNYDEAYDEENQDY